MSGLGVVFRRELGAYFTSPIAYTIVAAFLLVTALVFNTNLTTSVTVEPVNPAIVPNALSFFLIFFGPVLTMRLILYRPIGQHLPIRFHGHIKIHDILVKRTISDIS